MEGKNVKICSACGTRVNGEAQFCSTCGRPVNSMPTKKFCSRCGEELTNDELFCHKCGSPTTQNRDAQSLNNIAAYNNNLTKPKQKKESKPIRINDMSLWSFISWIFSAGIIVVFSIDFFHGLQWDLFEITANGAIKTNTIPTIEIVGGVVAVVSLILTTLTGILFWKNDKKARSLPVLFSVISSLAIMFWGAIRYFSIVRIATFLIGIVSIHIVPLLCSFKVIKRKTGLIVFSLLATALSLFIMLMVLSGSDITYILLMMVPMTLLLFSHTTKEPEEIPKKKLMKRTVVSFILTGILILGGLIGGFFYSFAYVGDYTNLTAAAAEKKCSIPTEIVYDFSDTVEKGLVMEQSVEKGTFTTRMNILTLTISNGKGIAVPQVTNMPLSQAQQTIANSGLTYEVKYKYNDTVPYNVVIKPENDRIEEGKPVILIVSKGPDNRIKVPNVAYTSESYARKELQNLGFRVSTIYVYEEECDAYSTDGSVLSQSLKGKQEPGTTITLTVAKPSIKISRVNFDQNSVGGVDVSITFSNISSKTIKYVDFVARFKNGVGDDVYCEIRNVSTRGMQFTGPFYSGSTQTASWDAVIYNWNCQRIYFDEIEVTFMDGTTQTLSYGGYWYS